MRTPDVTPAQAGSITAAVAAVVAVVQTAPERLQVPLVLAIAVLGAAWIVSDALLRRGRAGIVAARAAAVAELPADQVDAAAWLAQPDADGDDAQAHGQA